MGLPFLVLFFFKVKNALSKIKAKIIPGGISAKERPDDKCSCCGESVIECRVLSSPSIDPKTLELLELKPQAKRGPQGVRGWLLFLCLNLTIIIPFSFLYQTNCALKIFYLPGMYLNQLMFKQSLLYNIFSMVAMILLTIFSFYAGLSLWGLKHRAVKITKLFLITQLSLMVIIIVMRPFLAFSLGGNANSIGDVIKGLIPFLSYFSVWYLYLSYSRRVHNTYGVSAGGPSQGETEGLLRSRGIPAEAAETFLVKPR
ncbi:MAG: DUF2569 family protein [Deltaproteobacteria bacterium]|nr:DUF2569 family protein [Deltaproteobacteria bacterium]